MFQKDYIMRQIEQLSVFLARMLQLKQDGQIDTILKEIENSGELLTGMDTRMLRQLPDTAIISMLTINDNFESVKCLAMVELLRLAGEAHEHQEAFPEMTACYTKSYSLLLEYLLIGEPLKSFSTEKQRIFLEGRLDHVRLAPHIEKKRMRYLLSVGDFARAEDALYRLFQYSRDGYLDTGRAFYEGLLKKSDSELAAGNLPREEVIEGLAALRADLEGKQ